MSSNTRLEIIKKITTCRDDVVKITTPSPLSKNDQHELIVKLDGILFSSINRVIAATESSNLEDVNREIDEVVTRIIGGVRATLNNSSTSSLPDP